MAKVSHTQICGGCGGRVLCTICAMPNGLDVSLDELRKRAVLTLARIMDGGGEMRNAQQQISAARAFLESGDKLARAISDETLLAEVKRRTAK